MSLCVLTLAGERCALEVGSCSIELGWEDARVKQGREGNRLKTLLIPVAFLLWLQLDPDLHVGFGRLNAVTELITSCQVLTVLEQVTKRVPRSREFLAWLVLVSFGFLVYGV